MKEISKIFSEMAEAGKLLLVVTHDFEFLIQCCTHIFYIENSERSEFFSIEERMPSEILKMMVKRV